MGVSGADSKSSAVSDAVSKAATKNNSNEFVSEIVKHHSYTKIGSYNEPTCRKTKQQILPDMDSRQNKIYVKLVVIFYT